MTETFTELYRSIVKQHPEDRPAIVSGDETVTFGELTHNIGRFRRALKTLGVVPGTRVAMSLHNAPEALYLAFAVCDLGGCLVPLHPSVPPPFAAGILGFCRAEHLVVSPGSPLLKAPDLPCPATSIDALALTSEADDALSDPDPGQLAVLISTSGTTADPKFAPITQANLATVIDSTRTMIAPMSDFDEGRTYITVFPLSSSGIMPFMAQLALGATYVLTDNLSPSHFLTLIEKGKIDGMQCPPAYLEALASFPGIERFDLSSVTRLNSGTDFVPSRLLVRLGERFENLTHVGIGYGLAETSTFVMCWEGHEREALAKPSNIVTLIAPDANEVAIMDDDGKVLSPGERGEICIRGRSVVDGYYQNDGLTKRAFRDGGWLRTGDVGSQTADGAVELLGRDKYTIKRGGRSISPVTVSDTLMTHPGVALAAVVGVPHPLFGEMTWAFVISDAEAEVTEGDLNAHCRERLPPYMKPDQMVFLEALPRTRGVGKIDYERLTEMAAKKLKEMTGDDNE
jgi:long-chain acyl-CoA synthetase